MLMYLGKMSNLSRGPSIDDSYQVLVHLAKRLHRRRFKCEKFTDDGRQMPSDDKSSMAFQPGELNKTFIKKNKEKKIFLKINKQLLLLKYNRY